MPKKLAEVTSFQEKTAWFKTTANNWSIPWADQALIDDLVSTRCEQKVTNTFLAQLFTPTSRFVVRRVAGKVSPCMLPLEHFPDSVAIAWPLDMHQHKFDGGSTTYFRERAAADVDLRDCFVSVVDETEWIARPIESTRRGRLYYSVPCDWTL